MSHMRHLIALSTSRLVSTVTPQPGQIVKENCDPASSSSVEWWSVMENSMQRCLNPLHMGHMLPHSDHLTNASKTPRAIRLRA